MSSIQRKRSSGVRLGHSRQTGGVGHITQAPATICSSGQTEGVQDEIGSITLTPAFSKSTRLWVATMRLWASAVEAMKLSLTRHRTAGSPQLGKQFGPSKTSFCLPGQTSKALHSRVEPSFEPGPFLSSWQEENPKSKLAQNNRIHRNLRLVIP